MKIINVKEITLNTGSDVVLDLCNNGVGDTVVGEVYFQTASSTVTTNMFSVQGTVDGTHYQAIKLFDLGNMAGVTYASNAGVYLVSAAGYKAIKVIPGEVTNAKVTVKTTF